MANPPTKIHQTTLPVHKPTMDNLFLKMFVYGPPGAGKTTLLGTAQNCPAMYPCLFVNLEAGVLALVEMEDAPDIFNVEGSIKNFEEVYRYLSEEDHPYKSVCFDSLSELQRLHREALVASRHFAGRREDIFDTQLKDWGDNMSYILYWMRKFRDLPMHVLACAHSDTKPKPDGGERIFPMLNKALVEPMCGIFDVVGYLFTGSVDPENEEAPTIRKMLCEQRTVNDIEIYAKDRSPGGRIGRVIKNPTMPMIWNRIVNPRPKKPGITQPTNQTKPTQRIRPQAANAAGES